jgi:hypothetical protein
MMFHPIPFLVPSFPRPELLNRPEPLNHFQLVAQYWRYSDEQILRFTTNFGSKKIGLKPTQTVQSDGNKPFAPGTACAIRTKSSPKDLNAEER